MRKIRSILRDWRYRLFPNPMYVVIYDVGDHEQGEEVSEEYYGYFSSPAEARKMYDDLRGHNYHSAMICRVVERIEDR
jgi:hypothetical protein